MTHNVAASLVPRSHPKRDNKRENMELLSSNMKKDQSDKRWEQGRETREFLNKEPWILVPRSSRAGKR